MIVWLAWPSLVLLLTVVQAVSDSGDSRLRCTFAVNQLEFDLCPLVKAHSATFEVTTDEETPPTHTKSVYAVSLSGSLKRDVTLPADLQCPEGTWICLTVVNTRPNHPSEPSRILQVVPIAGGALNPSAFLAKKVNESDHHAPLQLTLHGGSYINHPQKATFIFHCDHDAEEQSKPSFLWKFNGTHAFSWTTRHACHRPLSTPQPDPEPDSDPPGDPETDPKKDIQNPPSHPLVLSWRFWLVIVVLATVRAVYVRYTTQDRSHPRMMPPLATRITRMQIPTSMSMRFLRWSPYAFGKKYTSGRTSRGPSNANINFADYADYEVEEEGEEVPLTPSPRANLGHGTRGNGHYGSFQ
ncbi:Autophagy-related protein 27 [Hypsizygus marmoreus]|uniref:Autophagy-related protein 27 n=1 Tax=Hypsizygus marmoreus TaxID=39966 RepID=A0A369J5Y1_HYPMA|nr:Autophagy-related protein 27 [Hypsizygus marmoreus]